MRTNQPSIDPKVLEIHSSINFEKICQTSILQYLQNSVVEIVNGSQLGKTKSRFSGKVNIFLPQNLLGRRDWSISFQYCKKNVIFMSMSNLGQT